MRNKRKIYLLFMMAVLMLSVLAGCTASKNTTQKSTTQDSAITANSQSTSVTLSIGPTCTGCGRCVMIDPEHFSISNSRIPDVVSQENLSSQKLLSAKNSCRTNAINLNS